MALLLTLATAYAVISRLKAFVMRGLRALWNGVQVWVHNPLQALVNGPFVLQLLALPFLLLFEQVVKWLHPERERVKKRIFQRNLAAANTFQKQINQGALYREGQTITLCRLLTFEASDHLVRFEVEPMIAHGFDSPPKPWSFSINWDYFFYDSTVALAESQFLRWRLDFDTQRIQKLMDYAPRLSAGLDRAARYSQLNHFFIYGRDQPEHQAYLLEVGQARQALEKVMHMQGIEDIVQLVQALGGQVHVLSHYRQPEGPGPQLDVIPDGFRLIYRVEPNPWAVDVTNDDLLQWCRAKGGGVN